MMDNLPLVFFTVLAQASVGLCLALCAMRLAAPGSVSRFFTRGYITALVLLSVAGMASFGHLGRPMRVLNVFLGLGHASPLSLEIIGVILFGGCLVLALLSTLVAQQKWLTLAALLPAAAGLVFVFAISHVYNLDTVSPWNSMLTPLQFYVTALLLGFFVAWLLRSPDSRQQGVVLVGIGIAIAGLLILQPSMFMYYGEIQAGALEAFVPEFPLLRFVLLAAALVLWFVALHKERAHWVLGVGICGLLFASELLGRAYFYDLLNLRLL
ncbi:dimethyl sulfoxide reductase anchor subunit [Pluralibacter gergoviae]